MNGLCRDGKTKFVEFLPLADEKEVYFEPKLAYWEEVCAHGTIADVADNPMSKRLNLESGSGDSQKAIVANTVRTTKYRNHLEIILLSWTCSRCHVFFITRLNSTSQRYI